MAKNFEMAALFISRAALHDKNFEASNVFFLHRSRCRELLWQILTYIDLYTDASLECVEKNAEEFFKQYIESKKG